MKLRLFAFAIVITVIFALCPSCISKVQKPNIRRRALIIACDNFVNYPSTQGACKQNAEEIFKLFSYNNMHIDTIVRKYDTLANENDFSEAVWLAFGDSQEEDINYLFISTHGLKKSKQYNDSAIVVSNGIEEGEVSSKAIAGSFDGVLGTNVIIIDACYSGAIINRGVSGGGSHNHFDGENFKVFTSSGGAEQSWYWAQNSSTEMNLQGAGFFTASLCKALSKNDCYPSDYNRDGIITHNELYRYLYNNNASSTVWAYPNNDSTELFVYNSCPTDYVSSMSNLIFNDAYIDSQKNYIDFSFNVNMPLQPIYQIVYFRNGVWDYNNAEYYLDADAQKDFLANGHYKRKIVLDTSEVKKSGYALINVIAKRHNSIRFVGSKYISLLKNEGISNAQVKTAKVFSPKRHQELIILVEHNMPCFITLDVLDSNNNFVYNICNIELSRPENLQPNASSFVWNGMLEDGSIASEGEYIIRAKLGLSHQSVEVFSERIKIIN